MNKIEQLKKLQEANPTKIYEILEGEIREVALDEAQKFWKNPIEAPEILQRKYIGIEYKNYKEPINFEGEYDKEKYELKTYKYKNPYTKEEKEISYLQEILPPNKQEIIEKIIHSEEVKSEWINLDDKEIGGIILEKHYNGNINGQLASLVKSQIKIIAVLKNIIGADMTKKIFGEEIENLRQISETRKICGLNEFDLSDLI